MYPTPILGVFTGYLVADSPNELSGEFRRCHTVIACIGFPRVECRVPELKHKLSKDPNNPIKQCRLVLAQGRGVLCEAGKTFNAQRGVEVMGVEQWARENLK